MISVPGYDIKREVGVGGMATVYLATQTSLDREVALKVMNPALVTDPSFSRRFLDEARTLASLSHPNIVAVYDVGVTEQQLHYFTMQHLPGGDLLSRTKAGMSEPDLIAVFTGVARALGFAHQRGFVHRDVSPGNIMFDGAGHPVLTDFGIARALSRTSRLTNSGNSVGTSHYMSPEQARGGEVDARSDLYSLACVIFEALSGHPPYQGEDGFAIAYAHVFEAIPALPDKYKHWQPMIERALAKDPRDRYKDCDEFQLALAEIANKVIGATNGNTMQTVAPPPVILPSSNPAAALQQQMVIPARTGSEPVAPGLGTPLPPAGAPAVPVKDDDGVPLWKLLLAGLIVAIGVAAITVWGLSAFGGSKKRVLPTDLSKVTTTTPATPPAQPPPPVAPPPTPPQPPPGEGDTPPVTGGDTTTPPPTEGGDSTVAGTDSSEPVVDAAAEKLAFDTTVTDPLNLVLALAKSDVAAQRYYAPQYRNAVERYKLAIKMADKVKAKPEGDKARQGLVDVAGLVATQAEKKLGEQKIAEYVDLAKKAEEIAASVPEGASVVERIKTRRNATRDEAVAAGKTALAAWDKAGASAAFERALLLAPGDAELTALAKKAKTVGDPGYVFRDGANSDGPEMIVVSAGKRLAVARAETTVNEFRRYFREAGDARRRGAKPTCKDREGGLFSSSRSRTFEAPDVEHGGDAPVVCVTYDDAAGYAEWLSKQTGKKYRLPTATEWRALGAKSAGDCKANVADASFRAQFKKGNVATCDDGFATTAPVRHYDAPAGIYDLVGNVREWTSDCGKSCKQHLAFGSSWMSETDDADPQQSKAFDADEGSNTVGIRVVRDVE